MPMKFNFNAAALEASIQNIADRAVRGASEEMRKTAIKIRDLAKDYAPIDTGTLERAIDYATIKDPATRRNVFVVYVDLDKVHPEGGVVGDYAFIMEQQLHPYGRQKGKIHFDLGFGSQMKAGSGLKVGGRFLERAMKDGMGNLQGRALAAASRVLGKRIVNIDYTPDIGDKQ